MNVRVGVASHGMMALQVHQMDVPLREGRTEMAPAHGRRWPLVLATVAAAWLLSGAATVRADDTGVEARLEKGEILVSKVPQHGISVQWGRAKGIVDAPAAQVMQVVQDYGSYADFLPHFRVSRVLTQRGAKAIAYMEAEILKNTFRIWVQMRFGERPPKGKTRIIEGKMTQGNIERLLARWEVTPIGERRTLVAFQMLFDPDLPIPSSIVSGQNATAARRTIKALRKMVHRSKPRSG